MNKLFWSVIFCVFVMGSVLGLGVSPARTTLDFEAGVEKEVSFDIINPSGKDVSLKLSAEGDLADYISFDSDSVTLLASEATKTFSYFISMPESLEPGLHQGEVVISEVSDDADSDGSSVKAKVAVATQIHIYVPYPGKYATAKVYAYDINEAGFIHFTIPVVSVGEFDLTSVRAEVEIYNKVSEKVDSFSIDSISIPSGEKKGLEYDWEADFPVGEYLAKVVVIYDEGVINLDHVFGIGRREIILQEISVNDFSLGEIVKLEMLVENKWSETIEDAYVRTRIKDDSGDTVSSFESPVYDIDALSKQVFVSYWDTAGVDVGVYETDVSINYGNESDKKSLQFEVQENELIIMGLGYVISAEEEGSSNALIIFLVAIIVILVILNLLWFLLFRKKFKK